MWNKVMTMNDVHVDMLYEALIVCFIEIMLDEVRVYMKQYRMWNMMDEGVNMFRSQCYENGY